MLAHIATTLFSPSNPDSARLQLVDAEAHERSQESTIVSGLLKIARPNGVSDAAGRIGARDSLATWATPAAG